MKANRIVLAGVAFVLSQCAYLFPEAGGRQAKTPKQLYTECMATFSDDAKCKELVLKSIPDADLSLLGPDKPLSAEQVSKLYIREELIKTLLYQNKLHVKNVLGEPDEKNTVNNWAPGMEEWVYRRPVSKYAEGSRPDKEIKVRFQKGTVVRVLHTSPDPLR